tara:strand:+ start:216 stop:674 length:459 start_codon:yes stop_codon:yes gene_type:complete
MKWIKKNIDTFYFDKKLNIYDKKLDKSDINFLLEKVKKSKDNKSRLCLHRNIDASIHQMLIFHKKNHKVRIHKHLNTEETYLLIKGKMKVNFFNKNGLIKNSTILSSVGTNYPFLIEVPKNTFHNQEFLKDTIFLEIKSGPFRKKNDIFFEN